MTMDVMIEMMDETLGVLMGKVMIEMIGDVMDAMMVR